jgi:predicted permease
LKWSARSTEGLLQDLEGAGGRSTGPDGTTVEESRSVSYAAFEQIRDHNNVFARTFAVAGNSLDVNVGLGASADSATLQGVSGNYFDSLGVRAYAGRTLTANDDRDGAPLAGVLSFPFWREKLGGDPAAVGRTIIVNGRPLTVVGITPQEFFGLQPGIVPDLWISLHHYSDAEAQLGNANNGVPFLKDPQTWWLQVAGRLKPGVSQAAATAALRALFRQSLNAVPHSIAEDQLPQLDTFSLARGLDDLRSRFSTSLFLLMSVVALVLLIACANVAGLLLARASARQREIAVRLSVGANRPRLIRQLLVESLALAAVGGAAALLVAQWGDAVLIGMLSSGRSPIRVDLSLSANALAFTFALSMLTGVLFGLAPAFMATRTEVTSGLRQAASRAQRFAVGKILVGAQVGLCLVVITGSGLFLRTLGKLQAVDVGFERDHLLLFSVRPGANGYKDARLVAYYEELRRRVAALPGVQAATFSLRPPIGAGTGRSSGVIEGYTSADKQVSLLRHQVGADYFKTFRIPILAGRAIGEQDRANSARSIVINEKLARTYFHGDNPLGHIINFGSAALSFEIVGVAGDVKYSQIRNDAPPTVYLSYLQFLSLPVGVTFEAHTAADPAAIVESVRREAMAIDRNVPVVDVKSQSDVIDQAVFIERTIATLTIAVGLLALALACIGLYGTMSYTVSRRTREIGIRMALGAQRSTILIGVVRETLVVILAGLGLGLPLTSMLTRLIKGQLFGVAPNDPVTMATALIAITGVTLLAGYIPARRAAGVPPIVALKTD